MRVELILEGRAMERQAGCQCGGVRVITRGEPLRVALCHCLDCRKHHGALFYAAAIFGRDMVSVTGESRDYQGRHFCPRCGSSVFAITADEIDVFSPAYEVWTIRRESWLPSFEGLCRFERNRME